MLQIRLLVPHCAQFKPMEVRACALHSETATPLYDGLEPEHRCRNLFAVIFDSLLFFFVGDETE